MQLDEYILIDTLSKAKVGDDEEPIDAVDQGKSSQPVKLQDVR